MYQASLILSLNYELLEVWLNAWLRCKVKCIGPILSWKLVLIRATIQKILYTPKKGGEQNKIYSPRYTCVARVV